MSAAPGPSAAVVLRGGGRESEVPWDCRFVIGRAESADLRLEDPTVSRVHAVVDTTGRRPVVVDAGGPNRVSVGRRRVRRPRALRAGDTIRLGAARVTVTAVHRRSDGAGPGPGSGPPASRTELLREALGRTRRQSRVIAAGAVVVVVGAGVLVARSRGGEPSPRKVAQDASGGIVRIARRVNGAEVSHGTGFAVGGGYVLTAAHVVRDGGEFVLTNTAGQEAAATIHSAAPCDDLALLEVDALPLRGLPLGRQSALSRGDSVVAVGYPASVTGGRDLTVTSGVVSVVESMIAIDGLGIPRLPNVLQTDTAVNPGNSGGPLLATDGRVVGVLSLVVNHLSSGDVSGQAYAVGVDRVRTLLDDLRSGRGPGWRGALLSAASGRLAVTEVALGSPAESAGVAVGDEVASLAGVPIPGDFESFCRGVAVAPGASLSFSTSHGEVSLP